MPTFSVIALDSLLEPGASRSVENIVPSWKPLSSSKPPISKLERIKGKPAKERDVPRPQMSPALYATPKAIPLPDPPSSFPPSPYIINHKARGPRLLKSRSEAVVSLHQKTQNEEDIKAGSDAKAVTLRKSTSFSFPMPEATEEDHTDGAHVSPAEKKNLNIIRDGADKRQNGSRDKLELGSSKGLEKDTLLPETVTAKSDRGRELEDFYDPGEAVSFTSNTDVDDDDDDDDDDDAGAESSQKFATSAGEFYDACDELSVESGMQSSVNNVEAELREMRLSLLMEIEKRKQAEDTLERMQAQWQRLREDLVQVGVSLPADPATSSSPDSKQHDIDVTEQLCGQFEIARFVSDSIARGLTMAEMEMEMESKLDTKNFEIARLSDRLHYYEAVNQEMSQRNQEAIEVARRERQRRKRRQRWIWGSIAASIVLGSAVLAWSYPPAHKSPSSSSDVSKSQVSFKDK